uniref:Ig-like domain-containing protein n=1 Tax=Anopheles maculatus TaxID=74869 RepID=A0A182SX37_9DIPT
ASSINGNQQISKRTVAPAGDTLRLAPEEETAHFVDQSRMVTCSHTNQEVKLKWRNPKNVVISETKGRVHIEDKGDSLVLIFEAIARTDQGNWTCEVDVDGTATATEGRVTVPALRKSFKMIVYEPISFRDTSTVQTAVEDKDATIRCEVKGHPEPSVSWYFNGQPLF